MRLIDADALLDGLEKLYRRRELNAAYNGYRESFVTWNDAICAIKDAPTVPHWIPVSERLPEEPFGCFVTVWDTEPMTMAEFPNILPYFVGWDGEQWNDADGEQCPFEVIAWMPLPAPYKEVDA